MNSAIQKAPKTFSRVLVISLLVLVMIPSIEYSAVAPQGSTAFLWLKLLIILPLLFAVFVLMVSPLLMIFRTFRASAVHTFFTAAIFTFATIVALVLAAPIRMHAFEDLAERSEPLVTAIHAYETKNGVPPPNLASLVPEFLSTVPPTGMAAYPEYQYFVGEKAASYEGNPWVLYIFTPAGGINFDSFMYFPRQNYPDHGYGGSLERVADWVYVHE